MDTWDRKWSDVKIPHTWNAKDMQVDRELTISDWTLSC